MMIIKSWTESFTLEDLISVLTFFTVLIGGCFGLYQWKKGNTYKKGEIMQELINKVRDDEIATIMGLIDWNDGFIYNGKFIVTNSTNRSCLIGLSNDDLFDKIDKTLSCFSYICYLYSQKLLTKKEMRFFEYELRRLCDNEHICNYLFSLFHWSKSLNVDMSFSYLIDYCCKEKILDRTFKNPKSSKYVRFLRISTEYVNSF